MVLKERAKIVVLIMMVGLLCVGLILSTAYSAKIKYKINSVLKENNVIIGEIENLTVKINDGKDLKKIEARAKSELGMVEPAIAQYVFLDAEEEPMKDFAQAIKERAYN